MVLVTGGTGFVGRNLIRELLSGHRPVRCLVRDPRKAEFLRKAGCELVRGDVTDLSTVLHAVTPEVDTVIHLVGILMQSGDATFRDAHVMGTRNVVAACRSIGVKRYLHMSALGTRKDAASEYHRTKWEAEEIVRGSGLAYSIFRPSVIFGREDRFTNTLASAMKLSPVVLVPGNGRNLMQPVFVKDVVAAFVRSLEMDGARGRVFELGGAQVLTFDGLIDEIARFLGKRRLKVHVPMSLMRLGASLLEAALSHPPITRDALVMLEEDNATEDNALPSVFGINPTPFSEGLKSYLH